MDEEKVDLWIIELMTFLSTRLPLCRLQRVERQENHPLLLYMTLVDSDSRRLHVVPLVDGLCQIQTLIAIMSSGPVLLLTPAWTLNIIMLNGQHEM